MTRTICKAKEEVDSILFKLRENNEIVFKRIPFQNFFYILEVDFEEVEFSVKKYISHSELIVDKDGIEYRKLFLNNNLNRNFVKKLLEDELLVKAFEADVPSHKRFLIENKDLILNQDKLSYVFMDIETFDLSPLERDFSGNVIANGPILSIATKDLDGNVWFERNTALDSAQFKFFKDRYLELINVRHEMNVVEKEVDLLHYKQNTNQDVNQIELTQQENHLKLLQEEYSKMKSTMQSFIGSIKQALCDGEKILLYKYAKHIKQYDVVMAWNGLRFDYSYIRQRMQTHDMNYYDLFVVDFDYMEVYKKNTWESLKSYALEKVAIHEFKDEVEKEHSEFAGIDEVKKIDWRKKTKYEKYFELFLLSPELFKEYNIQDVNLMFLIEQKLNLRKIHEVQANIAHCLLGETLHNSNTCDYFVLNEAKERNMIRPSKPSKAIVEKRKDPLTGEFPGGGFTFAYELGLNEDVEAFDFKSKYPTDAITYNISPDTYVKDYEPDLSLVFNEKEIEFIKEVCSMSKKFSNAKGELKKKQYEKAIDELRQEMNVATMEELMYKFIDEYKNEEFNKYLKENNYVGTPADINLDTRGWAIHPHRVFKAEEGIFPKLSRRLINTRDKVKYSMEDLEKYSAIWWEKNIYQNAIKISGNSFYGYYGFKPGREFMYAIPDTITTAARWAVKKAVLFAKKFGWIIVLGDTDSIYIKNKENKTTIQELENLFYEHWKEIITPYNTQCKVELVNPRTKEKEVQNHFIVFEHEKSLPALILTAKKRYYFKTDRNEYKTMGGSYKKTDTLQVAADLQYDLCKDILDNNFNKDEWKQRLLELKNKVETFKLEEEHVVNIKGVSKSLEEYGQPVIDGKTGQQKVRKSDGEPMFAPIPAQIKVAKQLVSEGANIDVGDKVSYVVTKYPPIVAISLREFRRNPIYDVKYYWERIIKPIIEIMKVCYPDLVYTYFKDCWLYTPKQLERMIEKMSDEE